MKAGTRLSYLRVIVIAAALGLLAKVAGPQSSQASLETNTARLIEGLVAMRAGLDVYRAQHQGQLPAANDSDDFVRALTQRVGRYGPYIREVPVNPFNGLDTVRFDGAPAGANAAGWRLDTKTGVFQADNDSAYAGL